MKPTEDRLLQPNSTNSGQPARSSAETNNLFVYGTLLVDDVINVLIGRIPHCQHAVAPGWQVVRLPQRIYPGLVPGQGDAVGKVFTDLTGTEWTILDAFEDPTYTLSTIKVLLASETQMDAMSYVWSGKHIDRPWSVSYLSRDELTDYLDRCRRWRQHYEQRTS